MKLKVLDCTLRDGGYFNNWNFTKSDVKKTILSLVNSGVDIIEVGYRSPRTRGSDMFEGISRYSTDIQLNKLIYDTNRLYSVMIDAKEYPDTPTISKSFTAQCESKINIVRVATYPKDIDTCKNIIEKLMLFDYAVTLNIMGISLLSDKEFATIVEKASSFEPDAVYFSDSFGDMSPTDVHKYVELIRDEYSGNIGIHTHDSNGLAFANTLEAIRCGVDIIDSTIMGMGRGSGNLKTEQILLHLYFKEHQHQYNPYELLDVIDTIYKPLREKYQWGWDYTYMLSASQSIHPTYCMNLRSTNQYTMEQIASILNEISIPKRASFDETELMRAVDVTINRPVDVDGLINLPLYPVHPSDEVLVIATGPSKVNYFEEIADFINVRSPFVIECNNDEFICGKRDLTTILNWARLKAFTPRMSATIVTGLKSVPKYLTIPDYNLFTIPCSVGENTSISMNNITIPAYVVGEYSIDLALLMDPITIYLAGFDGYPSGNIKNKEMVDFLSQCNANLVSITPTTYPVKQDSIFKYI